MAAPTQTNDEWITKEEAAKMLGVSTRQIERLAARGLIQRRYIKPGKGNRYGQTQVQGAAVLTMTKERQAAMRGDSGDGSTRVAVAPAARSQTALATNAQADFFTGLAAHLAKLSAAFPPPAKNPWLTLDEAAEFSGLTKAWLLEQAASVVPMLAIRDMGKHARGGRWRFFRGDLERAE
jgi:hypothetical protein